MSLIFDLFVNLMAFDIAWMISLVTNNLLWVFAFSALGFYFFRNVPLIFGFVLITTYVWVSIDLAGVFGWVLLSSGFLAFTYMIRVFGLTFAESTDYFKNKLAAVSIFLFLVTFFVWNMFIGG